MNAVDWTQWLDVPESVDWSATVDLTGKSSHPCELVQSFPDPRRFTAKHLLKEAGIMTSLMNDYVLTYPSFWYLVRSISATWTRQDQIRLYCELAAKHFPRIASEFRQAKVRCPASAILIGTIISIPESRALFFEFVRCTNGGASLLSVHASRVSSLGSVTFSPDPASLEELQLISYLLYYFLVATGDDIHNDARRKVLHMLLRASSGSVPAHASLIPFAAGSRNGKSDAVDDMVRVLEIEQVFFAQWRAMKTWLSTCVRRGCDSRLSPDQSIVCSRCGFVRYCGTKHRDEDEGRHWNKCFKPEFCSTATVAHR